MNVNFKVKDAPDKQPVVFDQIFAEKVGGGIVKNSAFDLPLGLPIAEDGSCIKALFVYEAVGSSATTIKVKKGSGIAANDYIAIGKVSRQVSSIDSSNAAYDSLTIASTFGFEIAKGSVLYEASGASVDAVEEVAYGYYDAESTTEGALKVVASSAGEGEIALADVTPYHGIKNLAADDYVVLKNAVAGVAGADAAPKYAPKWLLGTPVPANSGDILVKLVNGANVRKGVAPVADAVAELMPLITLQ